MADWPDLPHSSEYIFNTYEKNIFTHKEEWIKGKNYENSKHFKELFDGGKYLDLIFAWHGLDSITQNNEHTPETYFLFDPNLSVPTEIPNMNNNPSVSKISFDCTWKMGFAFDYTQKKRGQPCDNTEQEKYYPHFLTTNQRGKHPLRPFYLFYPKSRRPLPVRPSAPRHRTKEYKKSVDCKKCNFSPSLTPSGDWELTCESCGAVSSENNYEIKENTHQIVSPITNSPLNSKWWASWLWDEKHSNFFNHIQIPIDSLLEILEQLHQPLWENDQTSTLLLDGVRNVDLIQNLFHTDTDEQGILQDFLEKYTQLIWQYGMSHAQRRNTVWNPHYWFPHLHSKFSKGGGETLPKNSEYLRKDANNKNVNTKTQNLIRRSSKHLETNREIPLPSKPTDQSSLSDLFHPDHLTKAVFVGLFFYCQNRGKKYSNHDLFQAHHRLLQTPQWEPVDIIHTVNFLIRFNLVFGFQPSFIDDHCIYCNGKKDVDKECCHSKKNHEDEDTDLEYPSDLSTQHPDFWDKVWDGTF